jgi:Tfp pilus assembly protein PilN
MIELNLLEKKAPLRLPVFVGIDLNEINLIMLVVAILFWFIPSSFFDSYVESKTQEDNKQVEEVRQKIDQIKKEVGKNAQIKDILKAYQDQVEKLKGRSSQVDEILKLRTNPKKILEKLARSAPDDLWFNNLKISASNEIYVYGGTYSSRSLGEFITVINDSPYFAGTITPIKQENKQDSLDGILTSYDSFELKGKIKSFDMRVK